MVRLTEHLDMAISVDWDDKPQTKQIMNFTYQNIMLNSDFSLSFESFQKKKNQITIQAHGSVCASRYSIQGLCYSLCIEGVY